MSRGEAELLLRRLLIVLVQFKANVRRMVETDMGQSYVVDMVLREMHPWLFDEQRNVVKHLEQIVTQLDAGQRLKGIDFYNLMAIFDRDMSDIKDILEFEHELILPFADPRWVGEWLDE